MNQFTCRDCKQTKDGSEFSRLSKRRNGNDVCLVCYNTYHRKKNRANRLRVLLHYGGDSPKCECCGESCIELLCLDHISGGGLQQKRLISPTIHPKDFGGSKFFLWIIRNGFPPGYRLLCWNCNFGIHTYKTCPHKSNVILEEQILATL